ncbi:hypothetical protein PY365_25185 [Roseiarcaceae bacterium H3SJ34-1]|uniref:hypothetical protein n=1 Tax=Terripilifer ovatus TaxID=3032367 RepID=UPI003AB9758C|nr:hypothetical protein [Roseiarcaceae bacterium H3SJ34-1]
MDKPEQELQQLAERLARHGLKLPEGDLAGLLPMIAELEAGSQALRRDRPYALEPLSTFSLAPRRKA